MSGSVSVIIPTYNRAWVLPKTLRSIFVQTLPVLEVYVVDDGSTDNTSDVVESFRSANSQWGERLRYIRQPNSGKSVALNRALACIRGDWIAYNDSDDSWLPEKLEWQFRALDAYPECKACFTNARFSHQWMGKQTEFDGEEIDCAAKIAKLENQLWTAMTSRWIRMQTMIVEANTMKEVGPFDPQLRVSQDIDFVFRLALKTPLCYVNMPLVVVERDPTINGRLTSRHGLGSATRDMAHEVLYSKWLNLVEGMGQPELTNRIMRDLRSTRSSVANHYLRQRDLARARIMLAKAVRKHRDARLVAKWLLTYVCPTLLFHYVGNGRAAERR